MRTRSWSVRKKIVAALSVPLVSVVVLWVVATSVTRDAASSLTAAQTYHDQGRVPAEELVSQLQKERKLSVVYLGRGRAELGPLTDQQARTDTALAAFRRATSGEEFTGAASDLVRQRLGELTAALETLTAARETIERGELDRAGTMRLYTRMIDAAYHLLLPMADLYDRELARQGRAVVALGRARDGLAQEDALLAGVAATGRFTGTDHSQLIQAVGVQRALYADAAAELTQADRAAYQDLLKADTAIRLRALEDKLVAEGRTGAPVPVAMAEWRTAYDATAGRLRDIESGAGEAAAARARLLADRIHARLWLASVLGLVSITVSVVFMLWLGRWLVTGLGRLREAALHLALGRLPEVIGRLRRGEDIDADAGTDAATGPPSPLARLPRGDDEIGQVGQALNKVHLTAVESAVAEARLRHGLMKVFLAIARRGQDVVHEQLALLDGLRRRIAEPAVLAGLLRADHLATRLLRHAEDLVVLAGAVPDRGWPDPVPMIDVIDGAVSEVKDRARVVTLAVADAALVGRAVGDTIHLLAELIENGASFSPPDARVRVSGDLVPNGFAIEIEDRGAGMSAEEIAEANQRLAEPPDADPSTSTRLGLFVVAQLAARHDIRVRLRPTPYGGTTAVVLLPPELVAVAPDDAPAGDAPAARAEVRPVFDVGPTDMRELGANAPAARVEIEPAFDPGSGPGGAGGLSRRPLPEAPLPTERPAATATMPGTGLPRRVRQASLASELHDLPEPSADPAVVRSPEQTRALLAAFQTGTTRSRGQPIAPGDAEAPPPVPTPDDELDGEAVTDAGRG